MHLDEERLQRLLDGELPAADEAAARAHLTACAACSDAFAASRHEADRVDALLASLDRPVPRVDVATIAARAARSRRPDFAWGRVAATILVVTVLAAAAYALPGSPLPRWLGTATAWVGGRPTPRRVPATPRPDAEPAGIAVAPGSNLLVRIDPPGMGSRAHVRLTGGASVVVRAPAGSARFTSGSELLVIELLRPDASLTVDVPQAAPRVEMQLGDRRVFLKEGSVVSPVGESDSAATWVIPLAP